MRSDRLSLIPVSQGGNERGQKSRFLRVFKANCPKLGG
jgi:hypothetical protein